MQLFKTICANELIGGLSLLKILIMSIFVCIVWLILFSLGSEQ